jgi:Ca2+-transporting ATPase
MKYDWYTKSIEEVFEELKTSRDGLSKEEVSKRLKEYGYNQIKEGERDSYLKIFLRQFKSPLIYVLIFAAFIVMLMNEIVDGIVIWAVLIFNAIMGSIQEGKAQNALYALRKLTRTSSLVIREGEEYIVSSTQIVPGDIIVLNEGERVPADARIIEANNLKVDESMLTGESAPVFKFATAIKKENIPLQEQSNILFKGTNVVLGKALAVVIRTGSKTVIGEIAEKITKIDEDLPLKKNIFYLSRVIIFGAFLLSVVLFCLGILGGKSPKEMFLTVVSLSVSIIPEGLPVVVTLILALGAWRMSKKNSLIKRLQAVEALGQANIIAVDKTGTITKNEMVVTKFYIGGKFFDVEDNGYKSEGKIFYEGKEVEVLNYPEVLLAGRMAILSSSAHLFYISEEKRWRMEGDPTEVAILVFGEKVGFKRGEMENEFKLVGEIPFDYKLKYHAFLWENLVSKKDGAFRNKKILTVAGAPEVIINASQKIWEDDKEHLLTNDKKEVLEKVFSSFSREGMRVIAFAKKEGDFENGIKTEDIHSLTFLGFWGIKDPLRDDVKDAVKSVTSAQVKVVMITGDHKETALAIAKEAGIFKEGDMVLTGDDIEKMSDEELVKKISYVSVFARVTPEHKLRIIEAYRKSGNTVAMTGDGVNDALSLVAADLGVAMGKIGTEVAKEASDIVLLDDNFGNILFAIEEGKNIYKTLKKVIVYLFSTSLGEVFTIGTAVILGMPLPLLPTQIIWLNFVTDGFLTVALGMEPKEKDLIKEKFKKPGKYILEKKDIWRIILMALPMAIGSLALFVTYIKLEEQKALAISLTSLAVFQWFNAWNCRSDKKSILQVEFFSNKFLVAATIIVIFLQTLALYNPFLNKIFYTSPLDLYDWIIVVVVALSIIAVEELRKLVVRKIETNKRASNKLH